MNIVKTKICSKCKLIKNISEFVKHPKTKDGLQCRCNECRKIEKKEYYKKNKESINDKSKKYREDNAQKLIDYSRNYYKKNKNVSEVSEFLFNFILKKKVIHKIFCLYIYPN